MAPPRIHVSPHRVVLAVSLLAVLLALASGERSAVAVAEASSALQSKQQLCAQDYDYSEFALRLVKVRPERNPLARRGGYPRVFCFVNTISVHHESRAQAVADTWGQRCDDLVFFSNESASIVVGRGTSRQRSFRVVPLDVIADHNHLWQKHKATLEYVHKHYRHDYDWFYKADDDAYVIVENLRQYLLRPEIVMNFQRHPMQMGHRFNLTDQLVDYYIVDDRLKAGFLSRWNRWVFNSGGPGYVMNRLYLDQIVSILPDHTCLSDDNSEMLPDDASISFCMMWHDVYPWDTRDYEGRERWHADKPKGVYFTRTDDPDYWYVQYHNMIGGVRAQDDCCAPDSIAFHYITPKLMHHLERTLYFCREGDDIDSIQAFNDKYELMITEQVLVAPGRPLDEAGDQENEKDEQGGAQDEMLL
ncbi:hypothetical protein ATCC90586_002813 [Pythium insidiosum]|nr:hypothetical protein ATCC90586_002813 [Pythium insidiosum]